MDKNATASTLIGAGIATAADEHLRSWFPSLWNSKEGGGLARCGTFFRGKNRFDNFGSDSKRNFFDDKFLFGSFLQGINILTPETYWIILGSTAFSPDGDELRTEDLLQQLSVGRWFVKPCSGFGGHGAFIMDHGVTIQADGLQKKSLNEPLSVNKLAVRLKSAKKWLVQNVIIQSEGFAVFSPSSLNTVRCLTYLNKAGDEATTVAATLRMGNGRAVVDNASSGGIFCGIDIKTHSLIGPAHDTSGGEFDRHPFSGIFFQGRSLERIDDVFNSCQRAHRLLGGPTTIGWDVAMTDSGPCVVEANTLWMAALHTKVDNKVSRRLWSLYLKDHKHQGIGFAGVKVPGAIKSSDIVKVVCRVEGQVQRVGFRQWVAGLARSKGLVGYAQNLDDGSVLISLTGPALYLQFSVLRTFEGPPKASVSNVNILSFDLVGSRFKIL